MQNPNHERMSITMFNVKLIKWLTGISFLFFLDEAEVFKDNSSDDEILNQIKFLRNWFRQSFKRYELNEFRNQV